MAAASNYYEHYSIDVNKIRQLQCLTVHQSDVTCCDFAIGNNFTYLITGSSDKCVYIWKWKEGAGFVETTFSPLTAHKYGVTSLQVSPYASMLITGSIDGVAILWKLENGDKIHSFVQDNGDPIRVCRFSPNSIMVVTAGDNGAICIWDLVHKSLIRTIIQHEGIVQSISFTPDSIYLISTDTLGVINFWSVDFVCDTTKTECSALLTLVDAHDLGVLSCDISPHIQLDDDNDQKRTYTLCTSGNDHCIKIWKLVAEVLPKQTDAFSEIHFELIDFLEGHTSAVTDVTYNVNGNYLASTSLDKTCRIWNTENRQSITLNGHTRYVNCSIFSKNDLLLATGSNDKSIIIWDLTGTITYQSKLLDLSIVASNRGNLQENAVAKLGENHDNDVLLIQKLNHIHTISINCCDINRIDNCLATASSDKTIKLFQINEETNLFEETSCSPLLGHTYSVNQVEFSKNGKYLVSCSMDGSVIIWNYQTGEQILTPNITNEILGIRTCRLSYDNQLLVFGGDNERAIVFHIQHTQIVTIFEAHSDAITSVALTHDTKLLATVCSGGDLRLWSLLINNHDMESIYCQLEAHDLGVQNCDFSECQTPIPNVNYVDNQFYLLATCGNDSLVKLWKISFPIINSQLNLKNVNVIEWRVLIGHGGNVNFVRFSPNNGEILCSVATDKQARVWSPYSNVCLYVLDHDSMLTSCAFLNDSSTITITCLDKTVWIWKLPQKLVFQNIVAKRLKNKKKTIDWNVNDIVRWMKSINLNKSHQSAVIEHNLNGEQLLKLDENHLINLLNLDEEDETKLFVNQLRWLRNKNELPPTFTEHNKELIPHEFLCPITQEIMRDPVKCADGYSYERSAIEQWFSSGKCSSPLTNEQLETIQLTPNNDLCTDILSFLNN